MIEDQQIKSTSSGMLFEFHPLNPTLVMLKQESFWTKYIQKRLDIALRCTQTDTMTTSMIEARINIAGISFDALRAVTARTPLIKKAFPVVNALTLFGQEFFPLEMFARRDFGTVIRLTSIQNKSV